jgi:hypothetical protein
MPPTKEDPHPLPPPGPGAVDVLELPDLPPPEIKHEEEEAGAAAGADTEDDVDHQHQNSLDEEVSEAAAAAALACVDYAVPDDDDDADEDEDDDGGVGGDNDVAANHTNNKIKPRRNKKLPLTPHEALTFSHRGIYVDVGSSTTATATATLSSAATVQAAACGGGIGQPPHSIVQIHGGGGGIIRCSCNHKPSYKWDAYGYTRHFEFKCHKKYEEERLDEVEAARLKDAKESYLRMHPLVQELSLRKKRKLHEGEKLLTVEELRVQERHWMEMWRDAKNELKTLREDLKEETNEEVRNELLMDIEGLKKRKGDWAKLLGLNEGASMEDGATNITAL